MIRLENLSKAYATPAGRRHLIRDLTLDLPAGAKVALIGRNGAGKSTLMGMIAGTIRASGGRIRTSGTVSWPMGFSGSFANDLTGRQNARFVARIYGADTDALTAYVRDFAELGDFFDMPVRTYSAGMRARLAFGLSMGLRFDWYLVDEITAVGDTRFRAKSLAVFRDRLHDAGMIMVSHAVPTLRDYCTSGLVLAAGRATYYPDLDDAIRAYEASPA